MSQQITQLTSAQIIQGRLVILKTNQGEKMGLQLPDGRLTLLNHEQFVKFQSIQQQHLQQKQQAQQ